MTTRQQRPRHPDDLSRPADDAAVARLLARQEELAQALTDLRREVAPAKRALAEAIQRGVEVFRNRDTAGIARNRVEVEAADAVVKGLDRKAKALTAQVAEVEAALKVAWAAAATAAAPAWDAMDDRLTAAYRAARDAYTEAEAKLVAFRRQHERAFTAPTPLARRPVTVRLLKATPGYSVGEVVGLSVADASTAVEKGRAEYA